MTLHIVLPVHNRVAVTLRFIAALRSQTFTDFILVLVDDGSTDGTADAAREQLPQDRLVVLRGDGNLWWAGALQLAHEHLRSTRAEPDDAVLLINDDVGFAPDFLSCGMALLRANPASCVQAMGVDQATGRVDRGVMADARHLSFRPANQGEAPNCLSTRGLLMHAQTFANSGGFRPRWLPHYLSDYEFTIRLRRGGTPLLVDPTFTLLVDHTMTGEQAFAGVGLRSYIKHSLSNRAKYNPKHWSALAALICPAWVAPVYIARIWAGFIVRGIKAAMQYSASTR